MVSVMLALYVSIVSNVNKKITNRHANILSHLLISYIKSYLGIYIIMVSFRQATSLVQGTGEIHNLNPGLMHKLIV